MQSNFLGRSFQVAKLGWQARQLKRGEEERVQAAARSHLIHLMGKLKGLPQKVGQILAMSGAPTSENEFFPLGTQGEALGLDIVLGLLQKAWGCPPEEVLEHIEAQGQAASLGQVHRALLKDGREVAIKVRYPEIEKALQTDLKLLGWLATPFGGLKQGFDVGSYQTLMRETLERELDYRQEAQTQEFFANLAQHPECEGWVVPCVVPEWSRENVLVSIWEAGERLDTLLSHWTAVEKYQAEKILAASFFHCVLTHGVFHADPHPGNYAFRSHQGRVQVITYDFGCTARLTREQRLGLLKLFEGAWKQGQESPYPWYLFLGFNPTYLEPIAAKLPPFTEVLLRPFLSEGKFNFQTWHRRELLEAILGEDRWNIRVAAPAHLLMLMRGFIGLVYYLQHLGEPIWLRPLLEAQWKRHALELQSLRPPAVVNPPTYQKMAQVLKIQVTEYGFPKMQLTMRRQAVDELDELIPPETLEKIHEHGISLKALVLQVQQQAYQPMELFRLKLPENQKEIRVWLE